MVFRWHNSFTYESFKHMHIILQPQNIYDMHECQRAGEKNNLIEKVICKPVTDVISLSEILAGCYQAVSPTVSTLHFASLFPVVPVHIFILKAFLSMLPAWNNVIAVVQRLRQTEQAVLGSNGAAYYQVFFFFFFKMSRWETWSYSCFAISGSHVLLQILLLVTEVFSTLLLHLISGHVQHKRVPRMFLGTNLQVIWTRQEKNQTS